MTLAFRRRIQTFTYLLTYLLITGGRVLFLVATHVGLSVCGGSEFLSVRLWVSRARFTSNKDQNLPRRSVYRPVTCWPWKVKGQSQGRKSREKSKSFLEHYVHCSLFADRPLCFKKNQNVPRWSTYRRTTDFFVITLFTSTKGRGKCVCPRSFNYLPTVCLFVCLSVSKITHIRVHGCVLAQMQETTLLWR